MDYGMPTLIENDSLEDNLKLCKELGLQFIELNMNLPEYQVEKLENTEYFKQMAESNDIYFTLPDKKVMLYDKYFEEYINRFREFKMLCEEAVGDSDIKICIENTDGFREYEKSIINMLLESEIFGLTWDIRHSHGIDNVDEPFIMKNVKELKHFHIHDAIGRKNHLTLGTGEIDLKQRMEIARMSNARCVVETKTIEDKSSVIEMMKVFYASPAVLSNGSEEIFVNDVDNCINDSPYLEGYIFEELGEIQGYAMVAKSFSTEFGKPCIWIEDLYIKDEYRGLGLGSRFLNYICDKYLDSVLRLEVEEDNKKAIKVYQKCGFEVLPYMEMKK